MLASPIQIPGSGEALFIILSDYQVNDCHITITTNSNFKNFKLLRNLEQPKGLKLRIVGLQYMNNVSCYMVQVMS